MKRLAVAVVTAALILVPAAAASSDGTTRIAWSSAPIEAPFASPWVATLALDVQFDDSVYAIDPAFGTVDIYVSSIAGAWATALPVQENGVVYVSQQDAQALLAPGSYEMTAIFTPSAGSPVGTATTSPPLALTITGLDLVSKVELDTQSAEPVITASLAGSYSEAFDGPAPGLWTFTLAKADGSEVWSAQVAQRAGDSQPLSVGFPAKLASGTTYALSSTFVPVDALAGGVAVKDAAAISFTTGDGGIGELVSSSVPVAPWAIALIGVGLAALIAAATVLGLRGRRARQN